MRILLAIFSLSLLSFTTQGQANHNAWNTLLSKHVSSKGKVNYQGFKRDQVQLKKYLTHLSNNTPSASWSKHQKMAYWINAYNAFTVKLMIDNNIPSSITNLHGGKAWDKKFITLGNKKYSLNDIEHKELRAKFNDARIHVAVNCASKSCPPLYNKAFKSNNLDATLNRLTKQFVNAPFYNKITKSEVQISKLFDWYKSDFSKGDIITFLNKYAKVKINKGAKITFKEYDWSNNG